MLGLLRRLLAYVRLESDEYIIYAPSKDYVLSRSVDAEQVERLLRGFEDVVEVKRSGKWVVAKLKRRASRVVGAIREALQKELGVPVYVFSKYEIGVPLEVQNPFVSVYVTVETDRPETPFCVEVSGPGTYHVREKLKSLGFRFTEERTWRKCVRRPEDALPVIDDVIESVADDVAVRVPKNIEERIREEVERAKRMVAHKLNMLRDVVDKVNKLVNEVLAKLPPGPAREFVESREFIIEARGRNVCIKPREFLGDRFREILRGFREAGGEYVSGHGFCLRIERYVGDVGPVDVAKLDEMLRTYTEWQSVNV